jgi:hypothetical protein
MARVPDLVPTTTRRVGVTGITISSAFAIPIPSSGPTALLAQLIVNAGLSPIRNVNSQVPEPLSPGKFAKSRVTSAFG